MTGILRRELVDSVTLPAHEERWLITDFLLGLAGFLVWVAGSGALAARTADAAGIPFSLSTAANPSTATIAFVGIAWIFIPSLVTALRVREQVLNIRSNVERHYRVDRPGTLLAPPAVLLLIGGVAGVVLGGFPWYLFALLLPAATLLLVRTLAYSCRVYAFSHPLLVALLLFVGLLAQAGAVVDGLSAFVGRPGLVGNVAVALGAPDWLAGTASLGFVSAPGALAAGVLVPVGLVGGYLGVQTLAALGVRVLEPEIDRSRMRTGQRYPPFLEATDASPVDPEPDDTPVDPVTDGTAAEEPGTDSPDTDTPVTVDEPGPTPVERVIEEVSNTQVYTPPADSPLEWGKGGGSPDGNGDGEATLTEDGWEWGGPAGAEGVERSAHCEACESSFTVDTAVRFCPNCGAALDDS